ncbi:MAG: hypothetical protein NTV01_02660, partial [Bacteroidia bacterium]|nr:hypothetical protein [Bacteroidia bacterium]
CGSHDGDIQRSHKNTEKKKGQYFVGFHIGLRVSGIGYQVSGIRYRVSGIGYQVSGIGYQVSGIRYQVSGIRYRLSGICCPNIYEVGYN